MLQQQVACLTIAAAIVFAYILTFLANAVFAVVGGGAFRFAGFVVGIDAFAIDAVLAFCTRNTGITFLVAGLVRADLILFAFCTGV